jgi:hypothetical protein
MDNPIEVDVKSEWAGCTSWIPIEFPVYSNSDDRQPVLEDRRFNQIVDEIKEVLN